jgi:hypothetical protein
MVNPWFPDRACRGARAANQASRASHVSCVAAIRANCSLSMPSPSEIETSSPRVTAVMTRATAGCECRVMRSARARAVVQQLVVRHDAFTPPDSHPKTWVVQCSMRMRYGL